MGQRIEVSASVVDDVLLIDTDRSITGQDGAEYDSAEAATADDRAPGHLATRLFASDAAINHVFVGSNGVVVRRNGGWDDGATDTATSIVADLFVYYPDDPDA